MVSSLQYIFFFEKHSPITRINSEVCELPLLGGWGVLYFSEQTTVVSFVIS